MTPVAFLSITIGLIVVLIIRNLVIIGILSTPCPKTSLRFLPRTHGGITSSDFKRFSKFFYRWKTVKFSIKRIAYHHIFSILLHWKVFYLLQIKKKLQLKNCAVYFTRNYCHNVAEWMSVVESVGHVTTHMLKDGHANRQMHC